MKTMTWLNEPPVWSDRDGVLDVVTGNATDYWRNTFYGFVRDNGHFYHQACDGDFTAEVDIDGRYETLYDQAGLMLRYDERNWIKAGIELTDGALHFSVVVTRDDYSDWSVQTIPDAARHGLTVRLTRHAEAIRIQFRVADEPFRMARLAYLAPREWAAIGPMCCAPERSGFAVRFRGFAVRPPIPRKLHDDTPEAA